MAASARLGRKAVQVGLGLLAQANLKATARATKDVAAAVFFCCWWRQQTNKNNNENKGEPAAMMPTLKQCKYTPAR